MATSGFQLANTLAILFAGRNPQWDEQTAYTGAPSTAAAGIALQDSVVTLLVVALRSEVHRRIADVTMAALDVAATYTATVNGQPMALVAPADQDALLIGLQAAILADVVVGGGAGANQIITAQCLDAAGAITVGTALGGNAAVTLKVVGTVNADWTIAVSATGAGVLACVADAKTASIRIYGYPDTDTTVNSTTDPPKVWTYINGASVTLDYRGVTERVETGGFSRVRVEVHTIAGAGDGGTVTHRIHGVWLGPCVEE